MKKFLALLLALVMCMSMFVACNKEEEKSDKEDNNEAIEELEKEIEELEKELEDEDDEDKKKEIEEKIEKKKKELDKLKSSSKGEDDDEKASKGGDILDFLSDVKKFKATATFDSIEKLESYADVLGENFPEMIDVEDGKAELYFDADKGKVAILGSAKLDGDKHEIGMYVDDGVMIYEADVIDETAGVKGEYYMEGFQDSLAVINTFASNGLDDYSEALCDILVEVADADDEDDDGNRVVTFEADTNTLIEVSKALAEVLEKDGADKNAYPVVSDIAYIYENYTYYNENGEAFPLAYSYSGEIVLDKDGTPIKVDTVYGMKNTREYNSIWGYENAIKYEYDADSGKFEYVVDTSYMSDDDIYDSYSSTFSGTVGKKYEIKRSTEWEGSVYDDAGNYYGDAPVYSENVTTLKLDGGKISFVIAYTYTHSVYDGGIVEKTEENGLEISAKYSISGDTLTLTPTNFKYMDIEFEDIDKDFGLEIEIEKGAKVPEFPDYEEYGEDDWEDFYEDVQEPINEEYGYVIDFISSLWECVFDR